MARLIDNDSSLLILLVLDMQSYRGYSFITELTLSKGGIQLTLQGWKLYNSRLVAYEGFSQSYWLSPKLNEFLEYLS